MHTKTKQYLVLLAVGLLSGSLFTPAMISESISVSTTNAITTGGYHHEPAFTATGNNFKDTASTPSLQVNTFTVAAWFKNSRDSTQAYSFIVNKGGIGTDTNGKNMNFGLWLDSSERLKGGFEIGSPSTGADVFIRGPASYRDNAWHYAVLTYTGDVIQLYVDGQLVATKVRSGTAGPETVGTGPVRIGANAHSSGGYYLNGSIDEVRLWNRGMSSTEIQSQFSDGIFNTAGQVLYLQFN